MEKIIFDKDFFNVEDTLSCGQVFRFVPFKSGYKVFTLDKCAYCYNQGDNAVIEVNDGDGEYFKEYFDLNRDYKSIYESAIKCEDVLKKSAEIGKGIRILNQDKEETLFSFIVSQNNNIPRIKGIIERLCISLGEKKEFMGESYYAFPKTSVMAKKNVEFYKEIGLGYRAEFIRRLAENINNGLNVKEYESLSTENLKKSLLSLHGVGAKVADCVSLFGFHRTDSFPVDTWIEKVYREDFKGTLTDRNKITEYFLNKFKDNSGYFQQYLFYYKRSKETSAK